MFTFSYTFKYIHVSYYQACNCWEIRRVTLPNIIVRTSYESIRHGHRSSEIVILRYVKSYPQLRYYVSFVVFSISYNSKKGCITEPVLEHICGVRFIYSIPMRILISTNTMQWRARIRTERIGPSNGQRPSSTCTVRSCSPLLPPPSPYSRPCACRCRLRCRPHRRHVPYTCRTIPYGRMLLGTYVRHLFGYRVRRRQRYDREALGRARREEALGRTITSCQRLAFVLGISLGASTAW